MLKAANGKEVVTAVEKRLDDIRRLLPRGATIGPFYDQGYVVDGRRERMRRGKYRIWLILIP